MTDVVLTHGLGHHVGIWDEVRRLLPAPVRAQMWDVPGHGGRSTPATAARSKPPSTNSLNTPGIARCRRFWSATPLEATSRCAAHLLVRYRRRAWYS